MSINIDSFFNTFLIFSISIFLLGYFRKKTSFRNYFSFYPFLFLLGLLALRILLPLEFRFTTPIYCTKILTIFNRIIRFPLYEKVTVRTILGLLWILGVFYSLWKKILLYREKNRYIQSLGYIEDKELDNLAKEVLGKDYERISVYRIREKISPMTEGVFHGKIYIPNLSLSKEELKHILRHEYTHFLQKDVLKKYFGVGLEILFWWFPFIYTFTEEMDYLLELRCDKKTTEKYTKAEQVAYVETIFNVLKEIRVDPVIGSTAFAMDTHDNRIKQRFQLALFQETNIKQKNRDRVLCGFFLLCFILSYFVFLEPFHEYYEEGIYTDGINLTEEDVKEYLPEKKEQSLLSLFLFGEEYCETFD